MISNFINSKKNGGKQFKLPKNYTLQEDGGKDSEILFLDTFEWLLVRQGLVFTFDGENLDISDIEGNLIEQIKTDDPCNPECINDADLRQIVKDTVEPRVLIENYKVPVSRISYRILDDELKTVGTLEQSNYKIGENVFQSLTLKSLRGYDSEVGQIEKSVVKAGWKNFEGNSLLAVLADSGIDTDEYNTKQPVAGDKQEPYDIAVKKSLRNMADIIVMNEEGMIDRTDPEFLHDFRVSIRRTRSVISIIEGLFDKETLADFRKRFGDTARATNEARDLDVYYLKLDDFEAMLPPVMKNALLPLRDVISEKLDDEYKKIAVFLKSEEYKKLMKDWVLELDSGLEQKSDKMPVMDMAVDSIGRAVNVVLKKASKLTIDTPAEKFHRLRIDLKKLRYLIELFITLFPSKTGKMFQKELKSLQDAFGDYQDLEVQMEKLIGFSEMLAGADNNTIMALGYLVNHLENEQASARAHCLERLESFFSESNMKIMKELFKI